MTARWKVGKRGEDSRRWSPSLCAPSQSCGTAESSGEGDGGRAKGASPSDCKVVPDEHPLS